MKKIHLITLSVLLLSCGKTNERQGSSEKNITMVSIDIQGHRGARGLMPENSIPGFLYAVELGVNTLELDLAITSDNIVIVSHEPYFSSEICLDQSGNEISPEVSRDLNIYRMTYDDVKEYDCGSLVNTRFPDQQKIAIAKPALEEVFSAVENLILEKDLPPVYYNIEIKSRPQWDSIYHPSPEDFADRVYQTIDEHIDWKRVNIQSFDFRILQYFHKEYPDVRLAILIENELDWRANLDSLGFKPEIYSCYHARLSKEIVGDLKGAGMKVIPWTVNDAMRMEGLVEFGVDGIITDYPNIAVELFGKGS